jgi:hypothetical protein
VRRKHVTAASAVLAALLTVDAAPTAQRAARVPTARLVPAPRLDIPGDIDSNNPLIWELVEGVPRLFVMTSWGGQPSLWSGPALDRLSRDEAVSFESHPGHGVWMESIVADDAGRWYSYYHHETPADPCGRADRFIPRLGAAVSADRGRTWRDLGIVLAAPDDSYACASTNRFVLGGVGDVSVMLDHDTRDLYFFFSQYARDPAAQGIGVGRLAWADRDQPVGRLSIWRDGAWLPASEVPSDSADAPPSWSYPVGSPLVPPTRPWHDGNNAADVYWGAAVHWNTYLEQYVMLLNRSRDESFNQDGLYVSYAPTLSDPAAWSAPTKVMSGGGWYVQIAGLDAGDTDRVGGRRARFFNTGRSEHVIEFER